MTKEERSFYLSLGICPICKKYRLFGTEKSCPECRCKSAAYKSEIRERDREKYNAYMRIEHKSLYERRKADGMCPKCGKHRPRKGYVMCVKCQNRKRLRYRTEKRSREEGECYFCREPVKCGYKVCEKHYQMNVEKARSKNAAEARNALVRQGILY